MPPVPGPRKGLEAKIVLLGSQGRFCPCIPWSSWSKHRGPDHLCHTASHLATPHRANATMYSRVHVTLSSARPPPLLPL